MTAETYREIRRSSIAARFGTFDAADAAFFDLDRTVISGSVLWPMLRSAVRRGMYSKREVVRGAIANVRFARRGADDNLAETVKNHVLGLVAGYRRTDLLQLVPETVSACLDRVYPQMQVLIRLYERLRIPTFLCSAAPIEIVAPLGRALGMSGEAIATRAATDVHGVFTGDIEELCYGIGKARVVQSLADELDLDLETCCAYSDSHSDVPLLELVGHPYVVNPDERLAAVARTRGWPSLTPR